MVSHTYTHHEKRQSTSADGDPNLYKNKKKLSITNVKSLESWKEFKESDKILKPRFR